MGLGDNLMATGMARGAAERGKRVAFGREGGRTRWDKYSELVFRHNPNIAIPGTEGRPDVEWINYRSGHRIYNHLEGRNWIWNYDFKAIPGEMYFDRRERAWAVGIDKNCIIIEPNVSSYKSWSINKDWPFEKYEAVALELKRQGYNVVQFIYKQSLHRLSCAKVIRCPDFRHSLAGMQRSSLYIGPEGGMHHGAAAVGVPAVVLFGGFIPPSITGYDGHINLTGYEHWFCGSIDHCPHCEAAMNRITINDVLDAVAACLSVKEEEVA